MLMGYGDLKTSKIELFLKALFIIFKGFDNLNYKLVRTER